MSHRQTQTMSKNKCMNTRLIACLLLVAVFVTFGTGCASILGGGGRKTVNVSTTPENANFTITDEKGEVVHQGRTPELVDLKSGKVYGRKSYTVTFSSDTYPEREVVLKSKINGWYFGNIVFGGLIGLLIVDPATGAMWTLPAELDVNLSSAPEVATLPLNDRGIRIVSKDDIPLHLHASLQEVR